MCHVLKVQSVYMSCFLSLPLCVSGLFKYPQHMARETRGEMEPTDLKLFTGEDLSWRRHLSEWISRAVVSLCHRLHFITSLSSHCHGLYINGLCVTTADMKDPSLSQVIIFALVTACQC